MSRVPLGHTIWLSLHAWDGLTPKTWVGLDNYREIVHDEELRSAFEHSQDPLVAMVRELGGTVAGIRDRVSGFFTPRQYSMWA